MNLRLVIRLSIVMLISSCVFNMLAVAAGNAQPPSPALNGFHADCDNQPQPCWYGIILSETPIGDARDKVEMMGYFSNNLGLELSDHVFSYRSDTTFPECVDLTYFFLRTDPILLRCTGLRIGDVVSALGIPQYRYSIGGQVENWGYDGVMVRLTPGWSISAFQPIQHIVISKRDTVGSLIAPWRGLLPHWKYCQLEPDYPGCL